MAGADIAQFAMNAIQGIGAGVLRDAQANAENTINEANVAASNLLRSAGNKVSASRASLARFTQSVNNQRVLQNAGKDAEAAAINYRRARDSAVQDDFENQIAFAEQAGNQAAMSAFSGLSGGVVDIVNGATALRQSRIRQRASEAVKQASYDAGQRQIAIMTAGIDSLDSSDVGAQIDRGFDVAVKRGGGGNLFSDIIGGQDLKTLAGVSSSVGKAFSFKSTPFVEYFGKGN